MTLVLKLVMMMTLVLKMMTAIEDDSDDNFGVATDDDVSSADEDEDKDFGVEHDENDWLCC